MDYLFLGFTVTLTIAGLIFLIIFIYKLDRTPEVGPGVRGFNRGFSGLALVIFAAGLLASFLSDPPLADWSLIIGLTALAFLMLILAAEGFGVGFQQTAEDGVGFLRFFQLGSAIVFCMSFVPAFVAFITYASRLKS